MFDDRSTPDLMFAANYYAGTLKHLREPIGKQQRKNKNK